MTKKELLEAIKNAPDDAEIRIFPDWVCDFDYMPIVGIGYVESFNLIIIKPKYANGERLLRL